MDVRHPWIDRATALTDAEWIKLARALPRCDRDRVYGVLLLVTTTRLLRKMRTERGHVSKAEVHALAETISGVGLPYLRTQDVFEHLQSLIALRDDAKRSREARIEEDKRIEAEVRKILPRIAAAMADPD